VAKRFRLHDTSSPWWKFLLARVPAVVAVFVTLVAGFTPDLVSQSIPPEERGRENRSIGLGPPTIQGLHVAVREERYDLQDPTLHDVVARLNETHLQGPENPPSQGLTRYDVRPEWTAVAASGRCRVREVEIFVDVTMTLPQWLVVEHRPDREVEGWTTIEQAIREHEYMHRDLVLDAAAALLADLRGLDAVGCGTLRQVVASTLSIAGERLREAHAELDMSTPPRLSVGASRRLLKKYGGSRAGVLRGSW
jgi:predicted secreted Zn-dependent protease